MQVEFDHYGLRIDGTRRLIRSGSFHYFRLPAPGLWRDRLAKMRDAGLNAVSLYYPWSFHSEEPGAYDFTGPRDVERLHDLIEEAGLWLIARPGPYVCAEIDLGGLPAWLLRNREMILRCRTRNDFCFSESFVEATREWFAEIVPRFAQRPNLLLVQIENEYTIPGPLSWIGEDWVDLLMRWFGARALARPLAGAWFRRREQRRERRLLASRGASGQSNPYMKRLYDLAREFGVSVPIFHNDLSSVVGRQLDVDLVAVDRYPVRRFDRDWHDDAESFDAFALDEAGLDAHRPDNPLFYPELQGGWYDGWGGVGYERIRELLGPEAVDAVTKRAIAERATLWNYYVFCGGVTWGYMGSPDVYSSYDYAAPVSESGRTDARYEAVRAMNAFLDPFEQDLCQTDRVEDDGGWCPEHMRTRRGPSRRFVFLRNPDIHPRRVPTPEPERSELGPLETQVRVYDASGRLEAVSPPPVASPSPQSGLPPALPRLERWSFAGASPQLDPAYDDGSWTAIADRDVERGRIDIDALGVHYGFVWYRGSFVGPLDRLLLDARHCWAVWINRELVASGDQFQNPLGVGPDGARLQRVPLRRVRFQDERNVIVILVESLGHHKAFADDGANPRGIVRLDTGSTRVDWRYRSGLVRGERGMNPIVAFEGVDRIHADEVALPHGWTGEPQGVALYETTFGLAGVDSEQVALGLAFDPGRGKANLYLNGVLLGRFWPERGPQRRFLLPWGILRADEENHLAIALWKRTPRAALGKVRLEVM